MFHRRFINILRFPAARRMRRPASVLLTGLTVVGVAAQPALADPPPFTGPSTMVTTINHQVVTCGLPANDVVFNAQRFLCTFPGLPRVKHGRPYLQVSEWSKPTVLGLTKSPYAPGRPEQIGVGQGWGAKTIQCNVYRSRTGGPTIGCNAGGAHGFTYSAHGYHIY